MHPCYASVGTWQSGSTHPVPPVAGVFAIGVTDKLIHLRGADFNGKGVATAKVVGDEVSVFSVFAVLAVVSYVPCEEFFKCTWRCLIGGLAAIHLSPRRRASGDCLFLCLQLLLEQVDVVGL